MHRSEHTPDVEVAGVRDLVGEGVETGDGDDQTRVGDIDHAADPAHAARVADPTALAEGSAAKDSGERGVPAAAAAAVLRRAVHLDHSAEVPGRVSARELVDMAHELGVAPDALAKALAEWRLDGVQGAEQRVGGLGTKLAAALVGPDRVTVARTCRVPASHALNVVAKSLARQHLHIASHDVDRVVARRRSDAVAAAGRMMRALNGGAGLNKVPEVRAAVGRLPGATVALCLRADVSDGRSGAIAAGCSVGTLSAAIVVFLAVVSSTWWLLAAPLVGVTGVTMARWVHRGVLRRVRNSLEDIAEAAAQGQGPASVFLHLGRAVARRRQR
ncbi:MAG: hypothetical protein ACKV2O_06915 [Acidimicrobiales bacterium]